MFLSDTSKRHHTRTVLLTGEDAGTQCERGRGECAAFHDLLSVESYRALRLCASLSYNVPGCTSLVVSSPSASRVKAGSSKLTAAQLPPTVTVLTIVSGLRSVRVWIFT
jgi:hypothetical protein